MTITAHNTNVYVGLAGESALIIGAEGTPLGEGGMYRLTEGESKWVAIENGLPEDPQVRALLAHPDRPATIFAGTQDGVYRTDDRGENWRRTDTLSGDVWSLAAHPNDSNIMFAGYDAGRVCRSNDGGDTWQQMNTEGLVHPHITMNPYEICKRVIGLSIDPAHTPTTCTAQSKWAASSSPPTAARPGPASPTVTTRAWGRWTCTASK